MRVAPSPRGLARAGHVGSSSRRRRPNLRSGHLLPPYDVRGCGWRWCTPSGDPWCDPQWHHVVPPPQLVCQGCETRAPVGPMGQGVGCMSARGNVTNGGTRATPSASSTPHPPSTQVVPRVRPPSGAISTRPYNWLLGALNPCSGLAQQVRGGGGGGVHGCWGQHRQRPCTAFCPPPATQVRGRTLGTIPPVYLGILLLGSKRKKLKVK